MRKIINISLVILLGLSFSVFSQQGGNSNVPMEIINARRSIQAKNWKEADKILSEFTKNNPENKTGWSLLGLSQHYLADYNSAIISYGKALAISKDPTNAYNLACSYSRNNNIDKAFEWLNSAVKLGFTQANLIKTDSDLNNLRSDKRFNEVLANVKKATEPCMHKAENRQFDFWLGDWNVFIRGQKVGENSITMDSRGCSLVESWKAASGGIGKSLNVYLPTLKKWKQFYVGSFGGAIELTGEYKNNIMRLEGESVRPNGRKVMNILSFHNLPDKTVRQHWQISMDGGKTWRTTWDAIYKKKEKKN